MGALGEEIPLIGEKMKDWDMCALVLWDIKCTRQLRAQIAAGSRHDPTKVNSPFFRFFSLYDFFYRFGFTQILKLVSAAFAQLRKLITKYQRYFGYTWYVFKNLRKFYRNKKYREANCPKYKIKVNEYQRIYSPWTFFSEKLGNFKNWIKNVCAWRRHKWWINFQFSGAKFDCKYAFKGSQGLKVLILW